MFPSIIVPIVIFFGLTVFVAGGMSSAAVAATLNDRKQQR